MKTLPQLIQRVLRTNLKWWVLISIATFIVFRVKFAPVPVVAHTVEQGQIVAEVMGTGTLEARVKTTLSPRIQERLAEVLVDQNDTVKAGQLLARLDDGELKQQVEIAEAALAAAKATAERVRVDEARAKAVEEQARLAHKRLADLITTRAVPQADFDKAVEQLGIASADVKRSKAAILEAETQIVTAEKNLSYQKERLTFAQIVSPYDGLVVRRDRDPGGIAVPGGSLLQLISTKEIWVSAWVDETAMAGLATGQPARVVFRSEPGKSYTGEVARLGRETDRETREFLVDVRVKELPKNWTVGQRAEVFIETGRKPQTLVIPQRFIQWKDGKAGVFLNDHGKAKWRLVTLGLRGIDTAEITEGLLVGDQAVGLREPKQPPIIVGQRISTP